MAIPKYDTIVVGGGVSGLACALLRARRGERVAVVEQSTQLSPTLHGFVRQGTYMDSGFHYAGSVGHDGLLRHLLHELGIGGLLNGAVRSLDTVDHVRFLEPAFDFSFPQGWEALEKKLCDAFPADCQGIGGFLAEVRAAWEQGRTAFVRDYGRSLGTLFTGGGGSLRDALSRSTGNPLLQGLLSCHAVLYGTVPKETSLLFHSQIAGSYYESACLIEGGGRFWVETFGEALRGAGVELRCGRGVSRIHLNDRGEFATVELKGGETLAADRCISTAHPKVTLGLAPPNAFSPAYRRRIRELEETPSAVVLFGRCPSATFSGNLILARRPNTIADWMNLPLEERPLFVSSPAGTTGGVSVICPATLADVPGNGDLGPRGRPEGYRNWKRELADQFVRRLSHDAHDLMGDFELLDVATPLTFRDRLGGPAGGLYGVKHRLVDLPLLPRTAVKGLYLSGQAVVAPGVLGALCASFLTESCIV
jgi:all-trans-retinol 13,14-reductase